MSDFWGKSHTVHTITISCLLVMVAAVAVASSVWLLSVRPMTYPTSTIISAAATNETTFLRTAKFGEYPQTYVGKDKNDELLAASSDDLIPTGHTYSTYADKELLTLTEYTYQGKKYAKLEKAVLVFNGTTFSDDEVIVAGNTYFFYVEPLVWDLIWYEGEVFAVIKNLIGSQALYHKGMPNGTYCNSSYADSDIRNYFNTYFVSDAKLGSLTKEREFYPSSSNSATYGTLCRDHVWLPSYREINALYSSDIERMKYTTDLCAATYTSWNDETLVAGLPGYYYLRDVCPTGGGDCYKVNNNGQPYAGAYSSHTSNLICPAFVLSDIAIAEVFTPEDDIVVEYDKTDHAIAAQAVPPAWYIDGVSQITYTQGGIDKTEIVNAGDYVAKIELGNFTDYFTLTVTKRAIKYNGELSVVEKTYDATTSATVTGETTFDDVIDGDQVQLSIDAHFITKDVGTEKTVAATVTLQGDDARNYNLTNGGNKALLGKINRRAVVVNGIKGVDKEYDGTDIAGVDLSGAYLSLIGDMIHDNVAIAATGKFVQKDIGEKIRIDLDVKLSGTDAHNYDLGGITQTVAFANIMPRAITVKIDDIRNPINTELSNLTASVTSGSLATGDKLDQVIALSTDADSAVLGKYAIKGTSLDKNYAVKFANNGVYEIYDPALEPAPDIGNLATENKNLWLVIFCAGGVTAIVLILIILIVIIKHQHALAKKKATKQAKQQ